MTREEFAAEVREWLVAEAVRRGQILVTDQQSDAGSGDVVHVVTAEATGDVLFSYVGPAGLDLADALAAADPSGSWLYAVAADAAVAQYITEVWTGVAA